MYSSHAMPAAMSGSIHDPVTVVMVWKSKSVWFQLLLKTGSAASQLSAMARISASYAVVARIAGADVIKKSAGKNVVPG
jgi:hypothetical protein